MVVTLESIPPTNPLSSKKGTSLISDYDCTSLAGTGGEKDSQSPGETKWHYFRDRVMLKIKKLEQIEG